MIMRIALVGLMIALSTTYSFAHINYTGRSGSPGRNTCASSCHGIVPAAGTAQITGFPASYTPGQTYLLTINHLSGDIIANFNASCRIGTGTTNAGVISAGTNTSTYNVTGETNGVHFTFGPQESGTFSWQAPVAGTGAVTLYAGAIQTDNTGENTTIVLLSNEATALPGAAIPVAPVNHATAVSVTAAVSWNADALATSHDVYFGPVNPPSFVGNQATLSYDPPGDLAGGAIYYWRIDERNAAGVTPGAVWDFTTVAAVPPLAPEHLVIQPVNLYSKLNWSPVAGAASYLVYRDVSINVQPLPAYLIASTPDTGYVDSAAIASPGYFYTVTANRP
jgi:hypothetical protein